MAKVAKRHSSTVFEVEHHENTEDANESTPLLHPTSSGSSLSSSAARSYRKVVHHHCPLDPCHAKEVPIEISHNEHTLSAKYESQDYDRCENNLLLDEERRKGYFNVQKDNFSRWCIMALIGIFTAIVACCIDISAEVLSHFKYSWLKKTVDHCTKEKDCIVIPYIIWVLTNAIPVCLAAVLVSFIEPVAAGSGIPQVKCYLNGVKIPRIVRLRTLLTKTIGVTLSVVGGLAVGKEGPMIHSGAVIGAGISQGRTTSLSKDFKIFKNFRSDREKRDFVSGGAAAGVSAAFGAPVGGVLFSLEEGASFWNQSLTWRIFFCSMISTFTLNMILSSYHQHPGQLSYSGLFNFGEFKNLYYVIEEIPIYALMGALGGISGALFNYINYKLTLFRMRHIYNKYVKVLEAVIVAVITATAGFLSIILLNDCKPLGRDPTEIPTQFYCDDGEYNAVAAIWFQTPETSVRSLFHDPSGAHNPSSLGIFFAIYFLLSCWTYGLAVPSGLFIPSLLTGAAWGRLVGMLMETICPNCDWVNPGKYALVGAAAQLGGVVRMTLSLSVILLEATGNISFGLPIMIVLIAAKWVGDYFNEGIYDMHIQMSSVPILAWDPPPLSNNIYASEIMSHPVTTFNIVEKVGRIIQVLKTESCNGFPVVDASPVEDHEGLTFGRCRGLILRTQLITLLQHKIFNENSIHWSDRVLTIDDFRANYPTCPTIEEIEKEITKKEKNYTIDLRPIMNPSPYTVLSCASLPRIFHLFRGLGLRHVIIVNENHEVIGMITRKDLARYRVEKKGNVSVLEELRISD